MAYMHISPERSWSPPSQKKMELTSDSWDMEAELEELHDYYVLCTTPDNLRGIQDRLLRSGRCGLAEL